MWNLARAACQIWIVSCVCVCMRVCTCACVRVCVCDCVLEVNSEQHQPSRDMSSVLMMLDALQAAAVGHSHGPSLQCLHDVLQILWPKVNIAVERQVGP